MEEENVFIPVSRFEIIDHREEGEGRLFVSYGDINVRLSLQDNDETFKIFLTDNKKGDTDGATNTKTTI